ncbi:MAG: hypothetical protein D6769_03800 [Methanobacteriota archaeon]|nr:MAG: hypothetical protein D6769_03800 [Euryarchaeota archaeon]
MANLVRSVRSSLKKRREVKKRIREMKKTIENFRSSLIEKTYPKNGELSYSHVAKESLQTVEHYLKEYVDLLKRAQSIGLHAEFKVVNDDNEPLSIEDFFVKSGESVVRKFSKHAEDMKEMSSKFVEMENAISGMKSFILWKVDELVTLVGRSMLVVGLPSTAIAAFATSEKLMQLSTVDVAVGLSVSAVHATMKFVEGTRNVLQNMVRVENDLFILEETINVIGTHLNDLTSLSELNEEFKEWKEKCAALLSDLEKTIAEKEEEKQQSIDVKNLN